MKHMIKRRPGWACRLAAHGGPLKLTAFLYLQNALMSERYEDCAAIIAAAKEFGATDEEVAFLLEDPRRELT